MNESGKLSELIFTRQALIVFVTALALRLIFLIEFSASPLFTTPTMDMLYHYQWASAVAGGEKFTLGPFFRAPLYAYFLGAIYFLFGKSFWIAPIIQTVLGSTTAVLTMSIGSLAFSKRVGFVAGLITAFCGTLIFYDAQLLVTPLAVFLDLLAIFFLLMAIKREELTYFLLSGLAFGLSAIARPTILLFVFLIGLWIIWRIIKSDSSFSILRLAIFVVAVLLPIAPVTIYNYQQSGEFTLIGTYSGMNFYIGNNAQSDGVSARLPGARGDWYGMMADARLIAQNDVGRELTDAELSDYWNKKTWAEIANDPARFVSHLSRKLLILIQGIEISNNLDFYFFARQSVLLKILIWPKGVFFPWGILLPFAVGGLILTRFSNLHQKVLGLFLIGYIPAIVLFFVTTRYRQPLIPILAILAAYLISTLWDNLRDREPRSTVAAILATIVFLFASNIDTFGHANRSEAPGLYMMAELATSQGDMMGAEQYYHQSIKADSSYAQSYNELALLSADRGDTKNAADLMRTGLRYDSLNPLFYYNLAYINLLADSNRQAITNLKHSLSLQPGNIDALNNLGLAYRRVGQDDSAAAAYQSIINLYPQYAQAYYNRAMLRIANNQPDSAATDLERFLEYRRGDAGDSTRIRALIDSLKNVH